MSCFSLEVSDKTCFCFLGSDFNLFVGLFKVFKCKTHTLGRERVWGNFLSEGCGFRSSIPGPALGSEVSAWSKNLPSTAVWLISASMRRKKRLQLGILRWDSLKSEVEEKGTKCLQKKSTAAFLGSILFGLLTVVRPTLSSEQSQHRKRVTETAQKSLTSWILLLKIHIFTITDKWWCASHRNVLAFANLPTVAPNPQPTPSFSFTWKIRLSQIPLTP